METVVRCHGNGEEHCCWVEGKVCEFLEIDTLPDRHWVCKLRRQLGSWEKVHADPRYQSVHNVWVRLGTPDCGDFFGGVQPDGSIEGQCCFLGHTFATKPETV